MKLCIAMPVAAATLLMSSTAHSADDAPRGRANFVAADKNNDGQLNTSEFRVFIDANAKDGLGKAAMVKRFGAYDRAFKQLDSNEDGQITKAELAAARKK